MTLFLDAVDHLMTKGVAWIDLQELIVAAGHECMVKNFSELTYEDIAKIDFIVAQQQTNFRKYWSLCQFMTPIRQTELQMLDKGYAHEKLQELGLNYLNTKTITSRDDIVDFADEVVIMKPRDSMQARSSIDFAYTIMSKTELLAKVDALGPEYVTNEQYIIQEAVTNSRPIIFIAGYVNPQGEILIDGALKQTFVTNDGYYEDRIRNPDRQLMHVEEALLNELDEFFQEAIRQIKIVLTHFGAKSTPFCIQAIVDDDDQVQLLDFNFGFGKGYALRIRRDTPQYIIDRIKYTYGGADTIPANTTFLRNVVIDTPNGFTDEIKAYMDQHGIQIGAGQVAKDFSIDTPQGPHTFYHSHRSGCPILASSKQEADAIAENFLAFLSTLNY